jgi:hypothetical protein
LKNIFLTLFDLILLITVSYGQNQPTDQQKEFFDSKYGIDVLLHSGKIYYPETNIVSGTPYWGTKSVYEGDMVCNGKRYSNQRLMYDIYLQNFILIFNDTNGAEKQIVLDSDRIDSVLINEFVFIKNPLSQIDKKFVQKVHEGKIACYLTWEKEKLVKPDTKIMGYSFTEGKSIKYLFYNSVLYKFNTKRDLLSVFHKEYRSAIKQYISSNKINIRKVSTQQLDQLIKQIEKVIN